MFRADQYELLDFGQGRKLERFGPLVLDRPAPAVSDAAVRDLGLWGSADARFTRHDAAHGDWTLRGRLPAHWHLHHGSTVLELQRTHSGAVGVFPEQAENWDWIDRQVRRSGGVLKVLNLFAYTGASTLAAAAAGAEVVHVDAARSVVNWARRNAARSHLADAPVRWIVDDARKFVERELRRGSQYHGVILDPPTYGHGPKSEPWEMATDLYDLLTACGRLTRGARAFMLLTCHTPTIGPAELEAMLADAVFGHGQSGVFAKPLTVRTRDGRHLPSGVVAGWPGR
jgi:23S rRNA (cytosine1962-C5)-methyltransferase